jgi:lipoate-protein ligase A
MGIHERLMGEKLKVIPLIELSAAKIAAITEHLKYSATEPTLAFFKYKKAVTLSNKQAINDVNIDLAQSQNYEIVRTLGGGRAYVHNEDISFLFIVPNYYSPFSVNENYSFIADKFIKAFNHFGLNAQLKDLGKYGYDVYCND